MNKEQLEKRKKLIAELILENEFYVPMKTKEIAILLQIPKSQRGELQEVLSGFPYFPFFETPIVPSLTKLSNTS